MDNVPIFHLKTTLKNLDKPRSTIPIKIVKIPVTVITKIVEACNSFRVDQETLLNSLLTSLKKFIGFAKMFIILRITHSLLLLSSKPTGAAGLEPAVTVLETVGLPLTDAPKSTTLITAQIIRRDKFG
jgi:hypothetical protein